MTPTRSLGLLLTVGALALATGCHGTVGGVLANSSNTLILPSVLRTGDVGIGCATGEALGSMVSSYAPYSRKAERASVMSTLSAGMCMEDDVWEASLQASRALHAGHVAAARDAQTRTAQAHLEAARRYHAAFRFLESGYGLPETEEDCPKLRKEHDQFTYLMGLSSGLLAVVHDAGAKGQAQVPLTIPAAVTRGVRCLDNERWWGVPAAMSATLGVLQPDRPDVVDPWGTLEASAALGQQAGVRLAGSFLVQAAASTGDEERLRDAIRSHAQSLQQTPTQPQWAMLDRYATLMVQHASDVLWTESEGHRTPFGDLGTFPDDPVDTPTLDDDMFGDLLEDDPDGGDDVAPTP